MIPVYNEAGIMEKIVRTYYNEVIRKIPNSEFIIAEDGSTDGTKEILKKLEREFPITVVSSGKRKGYVKAVKDALALPKNNIIFFSDSSGQHEPKDFWDLVKYIDNYDMVIGRKAKRKDPYYRIFISRVYNKMIWVLFGLKLRDIDCGFRLIKKDVRDDVLPETSTLKHAISSEFTIRAFKKGYSIKEVPVHHYRRKIGDKKNFSPTNLTGVIIALLVDLLKLKKELGK